MKIILKNIPAKTKKQDIQDFVDPVINGGWLSKRGQIKNIVILIQKNTQTRDVQYHSTIEIEPDSVAKRVIKKLNRKVMCGKLIAVSEYKTRHWHNDPRHGKANTSDLIKNRRVGNRRGHYEDISEVITISSKRVFHTKGW